MRTWAHITVTMDSTIIGESESWFLPWNKTGLWMRGLSPGDSPYSYVSSFPLTLWQSAMVPLNTRDRQERPAAISV